MYSGIIQWYSDYTVILNSECTVNTEYTVIRVAAVSSKSSK